MKRFDKIHGMIAALCLGIFALSLVLILTVDNPSQDFDTLRYSQGEAYLKDGDYHRSGDIFMAMGNYQNSHEHLKTIATQHLKDGSPEKALPIYQYLHKNGESSEQPLRNTLKALKENGDFRLALAALYASDRDFALPYLKEWVYRRPVAAGHDFTVVLGKGILGDRHNISLAQWSEVVSISAGYDHLLGVKKDGTVLAAGKRVEGKLDLEYWRNIVMVAAGYHHSVGLKSDGTVVAQGRNDDAQCQTRSWKNIVMVGAGAVHTVGLRADGTVAAVGSNAQGQCNVQDWRDIVYIDAGPYITVGVTKEGQVLLAGENAENYDLKGFYDIIKVSAGKDFIVGLRSNGTVVCSSDMCDPDGLAHVTDIFAGGEHIILLHDDNVLTALGHDHKGQCQIGPFNPQYS